MLNKMCDRAYREMKRQCRDYLIWLKEDQSYVCAEYRPDWTFLGLDGDNPAHHDLLMLLDGFFIDACLQFAAEEEKGYVVVAVHRENGRSVQITAPMSETECLETVRRMESDTGQPVWRKLSVQSVRNLMLSSSGTGKTVLAGNFPIA